MLALRLLALTSGSQRSDHFDSRGRPNGKYYIPSA